ncbi:MAG: hypothetical protein H7Y30_11660, partial [Pyrinomonadaceae bacterium]|nr:hypothetical protein [Pyrinomonadaceae bacterium]
MAALLLLVLLCLPVPAANEETKVPKAPFAFSQTETLSLEWKPKGEQRIEIISGDGKEHALKVRLDDFGLKDAAGNALPTNEVIKLVPTEGKVSAAASLSIIIQVSQHMKVKEGIYTGNILAEGNDESSKGSVARLKAQLVVADARPLVGELTIFTYRYIPLCDGWWWCWDCNVPLREVIEAKRTLLRTDTSLGGLRRELGGSASVWWSGHISAPQGEAPKLELNIKDLKSAGKYDGSIQVNPLDNSDGGKVKLTVNASDLIVWPVIVLGLSILLTHITRHYIGVNRTIWTLREQEAAISVEFKKSERRFSEAAQGQTYASYSIAASLAQK